MLAPPPAAPAPEPGRDPGGHARREGDHSNRPLIALLVFVALAIVGWLILRTTREATRMEDCVMSGRRNCAPIERGER
ncbi:MAG TPA: hypothetical protein VGQ83_05905 [Polyangia bacterium]|jgi:hypothetical protein